MTKTRLLSTVAAALLISAGAASAQMKDQTPPERAPAAQQKAPAEKVGPAVNAQPKAPETTGQATPSDSKMAPGHSDAGKPNDKQSGADIKAKSDANMAPNKAAADKAGADKMAPGKAAQDTKSAPDTKAAQDNKAGASSSTTVQSNQAKPGASTTTTTGQGAAAGAAKLSTEQRTKITTVIKQQKVERIEPSKLNISISVGTRIPTSVRYYPLPRDVVVIYPEWRGYDYILVGDQIVIVDPRSHEIVAILDA